MIQQVFTLFPETPKGEYKVLPMVAGEQLEIVFHWFARIWIDMKAAIASVKAMYAGTTFNPTLKNVSLEVKFQYGRFKEDFHSTGSVEKCPDWVYFLGE